jgi:hypothetical protein
MAYKTILTSVAVLIMGAIALASFTYSVRKDIDYALAICESPIDLNDTTLIEACGSYHTLMTIAADTEELTVVRARAHEGYESMALAIRELVEYRKLNEVEALTTSLSSE